MMLKQKKRSPRAFIKLFPTTNQLGMPRFPGLTLRIKHLHIPGRRCRTLSRRFSVQAKAILRQLGGLGRSDVQWTITVSLLPSTAFELCRWRGRRCACDTPEIVGYQNVLNRLSPFSNK